jgi:hypothetical protein
VFDSCKTSIGFLAQIGPQFGDIAPEFLAGQHGIGTRARQSHLDDAPHTARAKRHDNNAV